jgi:hypothetical protein
MSAMSLPWVGQRGGAIDILDGEDVDPATGRLLTVAELQLALRAARAGTVASSVQRPAAHSALTVRPVAMPEVAVHGAFTAGAVGVVAAHAGAGASTVALAIADAAAVDGPVHLTEWCHPHRSGLASTTTRELGMTPDGAWRRGMRGDAMVDRRAGDTPPTDWPPAPVGEACLTLADMGHMCAADLPVWLPLVLVCRASVPGVRHVEQLLGATDQTIAVAALGPARWHGAVQATAGPRLRACRETGRLVAVPADRQLESIGLTTSALPKSVVAAGRTLLALIDAAHGGGATAVRRTDAPSTTKGKGNHP